MHARQSPCRTRIDRTDQPVGGRTAQKCRLEQARRPQVVDETARPANKRPILDARIAASDVWRSTHSKMPFFAAATGTLARTTADIAFESERNLPRLAVGIQQRRSQIGIAPGQRLRIAAER